jgi:hypothetical protein
MTKLANVEKNSRLLRLLNLVYLADVATKYLLSLLGNFLTAILSIFSIYEQDTEDARTRIHCPHGCRNIT